MNPTYQLAADGSFLDANSAGAGFLGTSRAQLLRRGAGSAWGQAAVDAVAEATASGVALTLELELEVGGDVKALTLTLVPCRYRGATTCFALGTDITDHRTLRKALEESEASLRRQADALSDSNTALRVILEQRNRDRAELERTITDNVETMVLPMLGRLSKPLAALPEAIYLDAAVESLREVVSPSRRSSGRPPRPAVNSRHGSGRSRGSSAQGEARARSPKRCTSPPPPCRSTARTCARSSGWGPGARTSPPHLGQAGG